MTGDTLQSSEQANPHVRTKRAIISGASRGIGAAIAQSLASNGTRVVIGYLSQHQHAARIADEILANGGNATVVQFDVADADSVQRALAELDYLKDPFDIVINNAAVLRDSLFASMPRHDWRVVVNTVLDGFFYLTQPLILPMVRRHWGRVINIVSPSGMSGNRGQANYSAAKGGLIAATKALAREVSARGVTVNAVCPGLIQTDMLASIDSNALLSRVPLGRIGTPSEVANAVAFLASEHAGYITGHVLRVDGGFSM